MEEDFFLEQIKQALDNFPNEFNVLEEKIDIEVQMKYFDYSKKLKEREGHEDYIGLSNKLLDGSSNIEEKREVLSGLASLADVPAFRAIEKYCKSPDEELKMWAVLALQESKMMLKSSLLDEQQVFISTGLGGKGQKLRYFAVFINNDKEVKLSELQQKILRSEITDLVEQNEGEVENITFLKGYTKSLLILPLKASLKDIFEKIIDESNQYGDFLSDDVLVTNVKELTKKEIFKTLSERGNPKNTSENE